MNVLVFGGLGFVGSNFVNWCAPNRPGWNLKIVDGFTYAADRNRIYKDLDIEIRKSRLETPEKYTDLVKWADFIVNFAAETHNDNSLRDPKPFLESNVNGVFELLKVCTAHQTKLIQISTDEVYGDFPLESSDAADENYPFRPSSPYSSTKAAGDLMVMAWVRSFKLNAIVTHCTNNFGPGQHQEKLIPTIISSVRMGLPIRLYGNGENTRDWIHVDDHSAAVALLIEKGKMGERYNIGANNHITNVELAKRISSELESENQIIEFIEDRPGHDLKYSIDSAKIKDLGWQPDSTQKAMSTGIVASLKASEWEQKT